MGMFSIVGELFSLPASSFARGWRRLATGRACYLELIVEPESDIMNRQLLFMELERIPVDPTVKGLVLRIRGGLGGWSAAEDLRGVLTRLRARGVKTIAVVEEPGNVAYWIASAAEVVVIPPPGQLGLVGLGAELTFFGRALNIAGIQPDFEAAGAYKSFGEPFTRSHASAPNIEAVSEMVAGLQASLENGVAESRKIDLELVRTAMAAAPLSAQEALEFGLVDHLFYDDQLQDWLTQTFGDKARKLRFPRWARRDRLVHWAETWGRRDKTIAVLHLSGNIVLDDDSGADRIRGRAVVKALGELRKSDRIKAVVLHVESGGGSAYASDLMWREVDELARKKPVVASFADVAASGGYYLAAPAAAIVSRSTTITGSIGVFGGKLVVGPALRKLGVTTQSLPSAPNSGMFSASRPFTSSQRTQFKASLQRFYDGFVKRVASGRRRSVESVEPDCRGRVWTGTAAHERGLVDEIGDLFHAVERARKLAGLHPEESYRRDMAMRPDNSLLLLMRQLLQRNLPFGVSHWVPSIASAADDLSMLAQHGGVPLAMLPFTIKVS